MIWQTGCNEINVIDDGYDDDGNYFDSAWCSCNKCGKYFLKTKTYMPFKIEIMKEEDVE